MFNAAAAAKVDGNILNAIDVEDREVVVARDGGSAVGRRRMTKFDPQTEFAQSRRLEE